MTQWTLVVELFQNLMRWSTLFWFYIYMSTWCDIYCQFITKLEYVLRSSFENQRKCFTLNTDTTGSLNMKIYDFRMNVPRGTFWHRLDFGCCSVSLAVCEMELDYNNQRHSAWVNIHVKKNCHVFIIELFFSHQLGQCGDIKNQFKQVLSQYSGQQHSGHGNARSIQRQSG